MYATKLDVGSFRLSFLRKFPKASLELKDVLVHSSTDFSPEQFMGINTDTLLTARSVSVEFRITDIIKGNYNIESISAKTGKAFFFTDTAGHVNYNISVKNSNHGDDVLTINLERINLNDIKATYNNLSARLIIKGFISNGKLKSRISGDNIDFIAAAAMEINHFQLYNTTVTKTISGGLNLILQSSKSGIMFKKGSLSIDNYQLGLDGFVSSDNTLDLNITGQNIDLARVRNYLPDKYLNVVAGYDPSGLLTLDCKIKGPLTRTQNPHVELNCTVNHAHVSYGKSKLSVNNLSFNGHLSNGSKNQFSTSVASVRDIKASLGTAEYTGSLIISNFSKPKTELQLKGKIIPAEIKEFFNVEQISTANGYVDADLKLTTNYWPKDSVTVNNIIDLKPEGKLTFNSFSIGFQNNKLLFRDVTGNLYLSDIFRAENLKFTYKEQNITIDGNFRNLPGWIAGKPVQLIGSADISFDRLIPEAFFESGPIEKNNASVKRGVTLPGDVFLDINFKIDSLNYKTFSSSNISGTLNYKPRLLTFKTLNMNSQDGAISGSGFVVQNSTLSIISRANFKLTHININKAFRTFHNFGQDFIKAENLSGMLSGSLSFLLPMDSMLIPQIKSLTAEGKYLIVNGALINFDPVKKLSSFIELSELENIHFAQLENDFFIRNNYLYVPQMDVKSTAADLSVNGKHSFDNEYEYHVKMLLSEILSKKRKKPKSR